MNEKSMVETEENRTIILQPTCLQSSRLSIKETKQNVVPRALTPPSLPHPLLSPVIF